MAYTAEAIFREFSISMLPKHALETHRVDTAGGCNNEF